MKKTLPLFSYLFHPVFIPVYATLVYIYYSQNCYSKDQYLVLFLQVTIINVLLPLAFFFLLKTYNVVDTIMLSNVKHRKIPIMMQILLTFVLIQKSVTIDRFPELYGFFLASLISLFILFVFVLLKFKISIHMMANSALTYFIIGISMYNLVNLIYLIALLFFINGLVATSRLFMKAHTMKELIIGYLIGALPQILLWFVWL